MRTVLWAALLAAICVGPAKAGDRDLALKKMAEIYAVANRCPTLEIDFIRLAIVGSTYGVDVAEGTEDFNRLMALTKQEVAAIADNDADLVCAAGEMLYGPDGRSAKGILKKK